MGDGPAAQRLYTLYAVGGIAFYRIYVSRNLSERKCGTETVVTAFTDHLAMVLRIALNVITLRHGRGYWRMNATLLRETFFQEKLRQRWAGWLQQQKYYPNIVICCERVAKTQIRTLHK